MRRLALCTLLGLWSCGSSSAPPVLARVTPGLVEDAVDSPLLLEGSHLEPAVTLDFDHPSHSGLDLGFRAFLSGPATVALTGVTWLDAGLVAAVVPAHAPLGRYDVHLVDPRDAGAVLASALEVRASCPVTYLDQDGDGFGAPDSGQRSCAEGRVAAGTDCNDADPLTHPGATEVCNGLDDNCDGVVDEGACALAAPRWGLRTDTGGTAQDWATAWSYAPGAVWVAGGAQAWVRPGSGAFHGVAAGCPSSLSASWAAADGWLQVGGGGTGAGRVATALPDAGSGCFDVKTASDQVVGVVGFALADGGTQVRAVSRLGVLQRWPRGGAAVALNLALTNSVHLEDLHGSDPDTLYAVGNDTEDGSRMRAFRWAPDGGWQDERVAAALALRSGSLHGLWVLGPTSAFAVGDKGTALEKRAGGWRLLPGLDAGTTLQAVRAFGVGRVYAVSAEGMVLRWDGRAWTVLRDDPTLRWTDLTGTSEEDLWVVGANGAVLHWPE